MTLRFAAITPKLKPIVGDNLLFDLIDGLLRQRGFAGGMVKRMQSYPAAKPWRSRVPTKGPRKGGKRTGALGRGWRMTKTGPGFSEVSNKVKYTVWVEGPQSGPGKKQLDGMRVRGWPAIDDEVLREWRIHRPLIIKLLTQVDGRLNSGRRLAA